MHGIRRLALLGLALGLATSACGGSDGDDGPGATSQATDTPALPETPGSPSAPPESSGSGSPTPDEGAEVPAGAAPCAEVWRVGERLPRTYRGCVDGAEYVPRDVLGCSSGQRLVRFDDQYYGVLGGQIKQAATTPLVDDADYRDTVTACRA